MQKKWGIFIIVALGLTALVQTAGAQTASTPTVLMTWQASDSYAPSSYLGAVLPSEKSQVIASLELISRNGQPLNLSNQTIYWYLDDNLLGGGVGVQRISFQPYLSSAPGTLTLKVELPDYATGLLIHEINVPIAQPQVVIEAPYPNGAFPTNQPTLQALPYFFAVTSTAPLSFAWSVNGQTVSDAVNPQILQISLPQSTPAGFTVTTLLTVQNPADSTTATAASNLIYQKQL